MQTLTTKQRDLVELVIRRNADGVPPTLHDLAGELGISVSATHARATRAVEAGWLVVTNTDGGPRNRRLVPAGAAEEMSHHGDFVAMAERLAASGTVKELRAARRDARALLTAIRGSWIPPADVVAAAGGGA